MKTFSKFKNKQDELEELAKPLVEYLRDNCHPYTSIVITDERVAVVETALSVPMLNTD
ncbi:MAG: hypothetical protein K2H52_13915 [Lachnospiraceae bacterium]|nr:hypothetical protein [Lachnospiraceae bacterium]